MCLMTNIKIAHKLWFLWDTLHHNLLKAIKIKVMELLTVCFRIRICNRLEAKKVNQCAFS